jgi:hypothetical protein
MILHCVFVRFKAAIQPADKQALYDVIAGLRDGSPGIVDMKFGPNISPEGLNGGFVDGWAVTFENVEARDAYLAHPDHLAVGEQVVAATDGGLSGLLVFDLEV